MHSREIRYLLLVAGCATVLFWGNMQRSGGKPGAADNSGSHEPGLIEGRLSDDELRSITGERFAQRVVDQNVRPAAADVVTNSPAAANLATTPPPATPAGGQDNLAIAKVSQGSYQWTGKHLSDVISLLAQDEKLTIHGVGTFDKEKFALKVDGVTKPELKPIADNGTWLIDVPLPQTITETVNIEIGQEGSALTRIHLRKPSDPPASPTITHVTSNKYVVPRAATTQGTAVPIYGNYLHLKGGSVQADAQLAFHVFETKNSGKAPYEFYGVAAVAQPSLQGNGDWDAELKLSPAPLAGQTYQLVAMEESNGKYNVAQAGDRLKLEGKSFELLDAAPVVQITDATKKKILPGQVAYFGSRTIKLNGTDPKDPAARVAIFAAGVDKPLGFSNEPSPETGWGAEVILERDGEFQLQAATALGDAISPIRSKTVVVHVSTQGPRVVSVEPANLAYSRDGKTLTVQFDPLIPLDGSQFDDGFTPFQVKNGKGTAVKYEPPVFNPNENSVTVQFKEELLPDNYTFTVLKGVVADRFGNKLNADDTTPLFMPVGGDFPTVSRGITGHTGPNVEFGEYLKPRKLIDGFNASDHVESRVSRLYYFRDAHRVAQIINREAKSYNRAAVDMQQQLADKARQTADTATDVRRAKERKAIEAARKTREAEQEQQAAEQMAEAAAREVSDARTRRDREPDGPNADKFKQDAEIAERIAEANRNKAQSARANVQHLRATEAQANEESLAAAAEEDRARENQFRREVAAAQADPDTYAPGKPDSQDPVRQVSVSVIGEGLIQLRGPIKGINVIRTMINQIDAPVGQVRVGVHTVQINGEKGDRMEVVASKIQRYIDHSRFLALQSAEMFRKAIVQVAAQKASELGTVPGLTQEQRDRSYLYAFFGEDFIRELETMDSEFLHTGNKLLSIHSMDSTSLASAMFVMALAKNTTRMQILQTFEAMMASELPLAEQSYFEAGLTCDGKQKLFDKHCKPEDFQLLSQNARFESIRGMFNAEFAADDTMTPIQREFVRLAQIFKSRLIVEMELKQRIMERSVIEERLGDHAAELRKAQEKEKVAREEAEKAERQAREQLSNLLVVSKIIDGQIRALKSETAKAVTLAEEFRKNFDVKKLTESIFPETQREGLKGMLFFGLAVSGVDFKDPAVLKKAQEEIEQQIKAIDEIQADISKPACTDPKFKMTTRLRAVETKLATILKIQHEPEAFDVRVDLGDRHFKITVESDNRLTIAADDRNFIRATIRAGKTTAEELSRTISEYKFTTASKERLRLASTCLAKVQSDGDELDDLFRLGEVLNIYAELAAEIQSKADELGQRFIRLLGSLQRDAELEQIYADWVSLHNEFESNFEKSFLDRSRIEEMDSGFVEILAADVRRRTAEENVARSRRPLDHKKFLDMLVDEMEDKYIELLEGTRAHTANLDAYIKRLMTSLDDDFNTQFYYPTFRKVREASQMWDVQMGQVETTTVLANNRAFAKVSPQATMEFDLPKRDILISEAMDGAKAMVQDFGALAQDPTFLAMAKLGSGQPTATQSGGASGGQSTVRNVLPGMSTDSAESVMSQQGPGGSQFGAALEGLIPDPAIYKFETGTGWEIRPVIQPDGQALVFHFNYMYTTNIREPVRADEKHLGRVKRHYVDTDVQLSNFELREISRYTVALKASRTSRGVPLFEDIPLVGVLFRPQPSDESSLQENIILGQSTIFPTMFDLMGLRWAPVVADLDPLRLSNDEFVVRNRRRTLMNRVFDQSSSRVDEFLRIPEGERRMDLYRSQETIPSTHPDGYQGPGANLRDSQLREGYDAAPHPESRFIPNESPEGSQNLRSRRRQAEPLYEVPLNRPQAAPGDFDSSSLRGGTDSSSGVANVDYRAPAGDSRVRGRHADYETTQTGRDAARPASRIQRLPPVDGTSRRFPGGILRPVAR